MNALIIITTLLAAIAPMMYFHGDAFYQGHLSYWGLPPGLFPLSFENTLIHGYIAYSIMGIPQLVMLFMYLVVAVLVIYNVHEISKFTWTKKLASFFFPAKKKEEENSGNQLIQEVLIGALIAVLIAILLLAVLISAIVFYEKANAAGQESAKTQHHNLPVNSPVAVIQTDSGKLEGRIIHCGTSFCAALVAEKVEVFPAKQIEKIRFELPNKLVKDAPLGR